jgi:hypothetical protein
MLFKKYSVTGGLCSIVYLLFTKGCLTPQFNGSFVSETSRGQMVQCFVYQEKLRNRWETADRQSRHVPIYAYRNGETPQNISAAWTMHFQIMMKERQTKCIFKVNHTVRISILLLHVSALQERHLQGAQNILTKLCVCYVMC